MTDATSKYSPQRVVFSRDTYFRTNDDDEFTSNADTTRSWANFTNGVKNPYWRSQIKAGQGATTSFDGERVVYATNPFSIEVETQFYGGNPRRVLSTALKTSNGDFSLLYPSSSAVFALSTTKANNQAKTAFIRKARKLQTTFQGGIAVGETLRTIRLIANPFKSLRKSAQAYLARLKKIGPKTARLSRKRKREILADTWLEHAFGWLPLLNDIDDAAEALANSRWGQERIWAPVLGVGEDESTSFEADWFFSTYATGFTGSTHVSEKVLVKYYGSVGVGSNALSNPRRLGFDPTNWLPTAWELLPYSFLVDYVSNMQHIVDAASFGTSTIRWIAKTVVRDITLKATNWKPVMDVSSDPDIVVVPQRVRPGSSSVSNRSVARGPYVGSLVPSLEFSLPSVGQLLNVTALVVGSRGLSRYFR